MSNSDNSNFRLYRGCTLALIASHCNRRENAWDLSNTGISNSRLYRVCSAALHMSTALFIWKSTHLTLGSRPRVGWWNAIPHIAMPVSSHRPPTVTALMHSHPSYRGCNEVNVVRLCIFPLSKPDECKWCSQYSHWDRQQPMLAIYGRWRWRHNALILNSGYIEHLLLVSCTSI